MTSTAMRGCRRIETPTMMAITAAALVSSVLSGCGSVSGEPAATEEPAGRVTRTQQIDPAQRQAINDCLQAAGLPTPTPVRRTAEPGSDAPPAGPFADPQVRAALEACGIEVPTPSPETTGTAG